MLNSFIIAEKKQKLSNLLYHTGIPKSVHLGNSVRIEDFDPITVWVLDEGQSLHFPVIWLLDESYSELFESFTCSVNVRYNNSDVSISTWILVSIVIGEIWLILGSPVVSQLNGRMSRKGINGTFLVISWDLSWIFVSHEIQGKFSIRKIELLQKSHSQNFGIKRQGETRIFNSVHCLLEIEPISFFWNVSG